MNLFGDCPLEDALIEILRQNCNFKIGQGAKLFFGRIGATAPFTPTSILTKTAWDALISATDETKIVVTNYITNLVIAGTDSVEEGGETNLRRMPELVDGGNAAATFNPRGIEPAIRAAMQKLTPYSAIQPGVSELGFGIINSDGDLIVDKTTVLIPIYNFFLGDTDVVAEKGKSNSSIGKFMLEFGWSNNLVKYTPSFNILATYPAVTVTP
ncbi:hypothetical protein [Pedobacter agri]|uniref:Uncharacterized protein n=1 Tax=Pedobacter agri TaxID=454586 RepID=A0A9X3I8J2_9SPHI|nr:hypothetical protein [Pedobacter agri]MCX3264806.1 hypothetical protein [Pedobacter agri]